MIRPGILLLNGSEGMLGEAVFGTENVDIGLESQDVVVHGAGKPVVDVVPVVAVLEVVGTLDVAGSSHCHFDGSVTVEAIGEHVVVVSAVDLVSGGFSFDPQPVLTRQCLRSVT